MKCLVCGYDCAIVLVSSSNGTWCRVCCALEKVRPRLSNQKKNPKSRVTDLLLELMHGRSCCDCKLSVTPTLFTAFRFQDDNRKLLTQKTADSSSNEQLKAMLAGFSLRCLNCVFLSKLTIHEFQKQQSHQILLRVAQPASLVLQRAYADRFQSQRQGGIGSDHDETTQWIWVRTYQDKPEETWDFFNTGKVATKI